MRPCQSLNQTGGCMKKVFFVLLVILFSWSASAATEYQCFLLRQYVNPDKVEAVLDPQPGSRVQLKLAENTFTVEVSTSDRLVSGLTRTTERLSTPARSS